MNFVKLVENHHEKVEFPADRATQVVSHCVTHTTVVSTLWIRLYGIGADSAFVAEADGAPA